MYIGANSLFKEQIMVKSSGSTPRGGKGGAGFIPQRPGGNIPSKTGKPSGLDRGNLPPKSDGNQGGQ